MAAVLAYFIGGSHDLEKHWVEEHLHHVEMAELMGDMPYLINHDHLGKATEVISKIEHYHRIARLRHGKGFVYECSDE